MILAIDPGKKTGLAKFTDTGMLVMTQGLPYKNYREYGDALDKIENIGIAIIERYVQYGARINSYFVQTQIQIASEIFKDHIMVTASQWWPRFDGKLIPKEQKRIIAEQRFQREFVYEHDIDAALMGDKIITMAKLRSADPFHYLLRIAQTTRKWVI